MVNLRLTVQLYETADSQAITYQQTFLKDAGDPNVRLSFDKGPKMVSRMRIEILNVETGETANIHIRELKFNP